jgi:hypothetical protein
MLAPCQYRLRSLLLLIGASGAGCWVLASVVLPLACVGAIRDLAPEELRAIEYARARGYAVGDTPARCSFADQMLPIIRWQDGKYRVVEVELSATRPMRTLAEDLRHFPDLKRVRIAAASEDVQRLKALRPDLEIER